MSTSSRTLPRFRLIYLIVLFGTWLSLVGFLLTRSYLDDSSLATDVSLDTGLRNLPSDSQWMTIYHHDRRLGYSVYSVQNQGDDGYRMNSFAKMKMAVAGIEAELFMKNGISVDTLFRLRSFDFYLQSDQYMTQLHGKKVNDLVNITLIHGRDTLTQQIQVPSDVYTYVGIEPMLASRGIQEGERIIVPAFDPLSMEVADVEIVHEGKYVIAIGEKSYRLNKIRVLFKGIPSLLWIDDNGLTFREETVMGLVMERTTPSEALEAETDASAIDLLEVYAIPVDARITDPASLSELTVEIDGVDPHFLERLDTERQTIVEEHPLRLRLRPSPVTQEMASLNPFLAATSVIQSQHPRISRLAREIAANGQTDMSKIHRLVDWVYRYLKKQPVVTLSSAIEILEGRQGDCSEHTTLFTSLSRAVGIPTKIHIGVVYLDGRFLYHAWPVVYVDGQWIAVDPTLGQPIADATHITFLEGDFSRLSELIPILGRVTIRVTDQKHGIPPL